MELRRDSLQGMKGRLAFWLGAAAFSTSSFLSLAAVSHFVPPGALAQMSAILVLSLVAAVVPGSVQIDRASLAADAAEIRPRRALPRRTRRRVAVDVAIAAAISAGVAAALHLDFAGTTAVGLQFVPALRLSALRGFYMGSGRFGRLGVSYAIEAFVRLAASSVLGIVWAESGFGIGILLATLAALAATARGHPLAATVKPPPTTGPTPAIARPSILSSAASIGFAVALANAELLVSSRNLPPAEADAFAAAAIPPKGIFVALFVTGWMFFASVRKSRSPLRAVRVGMATVGAGLALGLVATAVAPLVAGVLGKPRSPALLVAVLSASMAAASGTWALTNLALSLGASRAWIPTLMGVGAWLIFGRGAASAAALAVSLLFANVLSFLLAARYTVGLSPDRAPESKRRAAGAFGPAGLIARLGMDPRLGYVSLGAMAVLAFSQQPGKIVADTKIDIAVDPVFFLRRAYDMWEPLGYFGHVQNQSYGYFFPMGPYFVASRHLGIPIWVAQRLWIFAVASTAFCGVSYLAHRLGVGTPRTRMAAAGFYVTVPVFASIVAFTSAAALPGAVLPWMIGFLVPGGRGWTPARGAARSASAFAFSGAVNAAATVATLPAVAIYFLTTTIRSQPGRSGSEGRGRRIKTRLAATTAAFYTAVSLWWLVPLILLRTYGFNFLQYTESADAASSTQSLFESMRGSGYWLAYLNLRRPWLPGGWEFVSSPILVVSSGVLVASALAGLAFLCAGRRLFAPILFLVGVAATSCAYWFRGSGLFHSEILALLNGPLGAFRNVSKFVFLVTLPLSLGIAHLGPALGGFRAVRGGTLGRALRNSALSVVVGCLLVMTLPAARGLLGTPGGFDSIPGYWKDAVAWLEERGAGGRVVVVPGAPFGEYEWGRPLDDVLQPLARVPWAVRSLVPLGGTGSTRLLDVLEDHLLHQTPSPGLAPALASAGIRYLVVRNDLDWRLSGAPRPLQVKRTLDASGGFEEVAAFGAPPVRSDVASPPPAADSTDISGDVIEDLGMSEEESRFPRVTVYEVKPPGSAAAGVVTLSDVVVVSGGAESRLSLDSAEALRGTPFVTSSDGESVSALAAAGFEPQHLVVTDDLRRRDHDFGLVHFNYSYTLGVGERPPGMGATGSGDEVEAGVSRGGPIPREIMHDTDDTHKTTRIFSGAARITASSYSSWLVQLPELRPYAAFDADPSTAWVTGAPGRSTGEWIEIGFDDPLELPEIRITPLADNPFRPLIREVEVSTDAGSARSRLDASETPQRVAVPGGATKRLRIVLTAVEGEANSAFSGAGIREVRIPGLSVVEIVRAPSDRTAPRQSAVFSRRRLHPSLVGRSDEETVLRRSFKLDSFGSYTIEGRAVPVPGDEIDRLIAVRGPVTIAASSSFGGLPEFRPSNLLDGDTSTIWAAALSSPLPAPLGLWEGSKAYSRTGTLPPVFEGIQSVPDPSPSLVLDFGKSVTLQELRVITTTAGPVAPPTRLRLVGEHDVREADVLSGGRAAFEPLATRVLRLEFPSVRTRISVDGMTGARTQLPVGFADLQIPALSDVAYTVPPPDDPFRLPCGSGPTLLVDGEPYDTEVEGRVSDLIFLRPLMFRTCRSFEIGEGEAEHRIEGLAGERPFAISDVTITRRQEGGVARQLGALGEVRVEDWGPRTRGLWIEPGPARILYVNENFNRGWRAAAGDTVLEPITLDGWKQGFIVPDGVGGEVRLVYGPGRLHSLTISWGLVLVGLVLSYAFLATAITPEGKAVGDNGLHQYTMGTALVGRPGAVLVTIVTVATALVVAVPVFPVAIAVIGIASLLSRRISPKAIAAACATAAASTFLLATISAAAGLPAAPADGVGPFGYPAQVAAGIAMVFAVLPGTTVRRTR